MERFIRLKGLLTIKLTGDKYEQSFPISHETITIRGPPLGQTAIRDAPSMGIAHSTLQLLTPLFHIINSITSFPRENSRVYNIFSLTGGFSTAARIKFTLTYEKIGTLIANVHLLRHISDSDYYEGKMNIEVSNQGDFRAPKEVYSEKVFGDGMVNYSKAGKGVLRFERQQIQFTTLNEYPPRTLRGSIFGTGHIPVDESSCLLDDRSILEDNRDIFRVRLDGKGFCNTACPHSSTYCTIYCLDYPVLESKRRCKFDIPIL